MPSSRIPSRLWSRTLYQILIIIYHMKSVKKGDITVHKSICQLNVTWDRWRYLVHGLDVYSRIEAFICKVLSLAWLTDCNSERHHFRVCWSQIINSCQNFQPTPERLPTLHYVSSASLTAFRVLPNTCTAAQITYDATSESVLAVVVPSKWPGGHTMLRRWPLHLNNYSSSLFSPLLWSEVR